jgi:hypothetical protein
MNMGYKGSNRARTKEQSARYRRTQYLKLKRMIDEIKLASGGCSRCGFDEHPAALDFHHRDDEEKLFSIGAGPCQYSWAKILEEIAKCDVLCANCHRITFVQRYEE